MTHSTAAKSACSERAIDVSDTATMLPSRLIMNDGIDTHSKINKFFDTFTAYLLHSVA